MISSSVLHICPHSTVERCCSMSLEGLAEMVQAAAALQSTLREPRWRTEDRAWRREDCAWRRQDVSWRLQDLEFVCVSAAMPPCLP